MVLVWMDFRSPMTKSTDYNTGHRRVKAASLRSRISRPKEATVDPVFFKLRNSTHLCSAFMSHTGCFLYLSFCVGGFPSLILCLILVIFNLLAVPWLHGHFDSRLNVVIISKA